MQQQFREYILPFLLTPVTSVAGIPVVKKNSLEFCMIPRKENDAGTQQAGVIGKTVTHTQKSRLRI